MIRNLVCVAFSATLFEVAMQPLAKADMLVLESNVPGIQKGAHESDDWVPSLPPGGHVRVLLSSHETKVFEGASTATTRAIDPYGGTRGSRTPN